MCIAGAEGAETFKTKYIWGPKSPKTPENLFCGAAEDAGKHEHMWMLDAKCAETLEHIYMLGAEGAGTLGHMFISGARTIEKRFTN